MRISLQFRDVPRGIGSRSCWCVVSHVTVHAGPQALPQFAAARGISAARADARYGPIIDRHANIGLSIEAVAGR